MLQTLAITAPIYLLVALGYLAVRGGAIEPADARVLGAFVMKFALPALVFLALVQRPVREIMDPRYLVDYALGSLAIFFSSFAFGRVAQRKGVAASALSALGMSNSNSGFIGYPVAAQVFGPPTAAVALAMCMLVENLVMIPLALLLAESESRREGGWPRALARSLAQVARQPLVLAIAAGFGVALAGIPLGEVLARTVGLLAASSTAVSLFVIGTVLHGLRVRGMRRDVGAIASAKLVLHPLLVGGCVWLLPPADPPLRAAAVLFASSPMLGIYPILAQKFGLEGQSAAALVLATVASFVTISVVLLVLQPWLPVR